MNGYEIEKYHTLYQIAVDFVEYKNAYYEAKDEYTYCDSPKIESKPAFRTSADFGDVIVPLVVAAIWYVVGAAFFMLVVWFLDWVLFSENPISLVCWCIVGAGAILTPIIVMIVFFVNNYLPTKKLDQILYQERLAKWNEKLEKENKRIAVEAQNKTVLSQKYEVAKQTYEAVAKKFEEQCICCNISPTYRDEKLIRDAYHYYSDLTKFSSIVDCIKSYHEKQREERRKELEREEWEDEMYLKKERRREEKRNRQLRAVREEREREETRQKNQRFYGRDEAPEYGDIIDGKFVLDSIGGSVTFLDDSGESIESYRDNYGNWYRLDDDSPI